jgi:hypothetical protein
MASSPGEWGDRLTVGVNDEGVDGEVATRYGVLQTEIFNLEVQSDPERGGPRELIRNVTVVPGPRQVDRVLERESQLVRANPSVALPATRPPNLPIANPPVFFASGGLGDDLDTAAYQRGLDALAKVDIFNLLCIPPDKPDTPLGTLKNVYQAALPVCRDRRAMLIVDPPVEWGGNGLETLLKDPGAELAKIGLAGPDARNAAIYYPRVLESDPAREGQTSTYPPCGLIAGIMARTDVQRGVWKAPAGLDAAINGIQGFDVELDNGENGALNQYGINCLRSFGVAGRVVWGARTMRGADRLADEYKYIPIRRLALYIEETLYRATQWVVFEPNDEPLWAQIRLNVGAFMHTLFRQGAFQGTTPRDAYFVKCDKEVNPQNDIDRGIVNIIVGFAPLKPAEFVIIKLQQIAGQIET